MMHKSMRVLRDERTKLVNSFGRHIMDLVELVSNILPDNAELGVVKKVAHRAIYSAGNMVIEEVGPELWPHRDSISNDDFEFLTQIDYGAKLDSKKHLLGDEGKESTYRSLIDVALSQYDKCSDAERNQIHCIIKQLFMDYVKYTIHCRKHIID